MEYLDEERLRGVAGWLAFLCIIVLFLSPARALITTWKEISAAESASPELLELAAWSRIKLYSWALAIGASAFSIYTGWRLSSVHKPTSVYLAIAALWILGPGLALLDAAVASIAFGVPYLLDAESTRALVQGFVSALVWTIYLSVSRRVRNTYRPDEGGAPA